MDITPSNLNLFFTTVGSRFWAAYKVAEPWWQKIAMLQTCDTEEWADGWIGMIDTYREWLGPRMVHTPAPQTYIVPIQNFELTVAVSKFKIKDDRYGVYFPRLAMMGMQAQKWPDYQVRDLLQAKKSQSSTARQKGLDGLSHWNTAHPIDFYDSSKGTYVTDFRGGVTINSVTVGGAFTVNAFNTLWAEFSSRRGETGEALGISPDLSMFPPQLRAAATTILQGQFFAPPQLGTLGAGSGANAPFVGAMDNPMRGWTDLLINDDFASEADEWYMLCTKGPIKPFQWILREAPDFVARVDPQDPRVFDLAEFVFGSEARGCPAWGPAFLSAISGSS